MALTALSNECLPTAYCVEKLNSWRLSSRREKSRVCHDRALGKGSSTPCHGSETVNLEFFNTIDREQPSARLSSPLCFIRRERPCGQINIRTANAHPASSILPTIDNYDYLIHDFPSLHIVQPIKSGRVEDSLQARSIVDVVNIQDMFRLVDIRIDVKRGRKSPSCLAKHESVISKVVVAVADRDVERHAAK